MTEHATLGASSSKRWMTCAGSVRLSADQPNTSSIYAMEGTAAHDVAEQCLRDNVNAVQYVGSHMSVLDQSDESGETYELIEVTEEMAEAVQVYLDAVREAAEDNELHVEMMVDLGPAQPDDVDAPMFGTSDCSFLIDDALEVWDYKHGRGTVVEVEGNTQCLYYALGVILKLGKKPKTIRTVIVQPRAAHPDGPVRSHTYTWAELVEFKNEVMAAAQRAMDPDAPVGPVGDHCKFCPAMAICPAQHENALVVAGDEFGTFPVEAPPEPGDLTETEFLEVLRATEYIENYLRSVRDHAKGLLERGVDVPGWKLVAKRASRKWTDEDATAQYLRRKLGKSGAYKSTLISPHQAEVALKQKGSFRKNHLASMIVSESSGTNLAREDDPKPAVLPGAEAADEFAEEL